MKIAITKILLFCILIIFSVAGYSQNSTIDSLQRILLKQDDDTSKVNTLNELSRQYDHNRDSAMLYAGQALALSQKMHFKIGEGDAYYSYGLALTGLNYFGEQGTLAEVLNYFNKALKIFKELGKELKMGDCYNRISRAHETIAQNRPEAIRYTLEALRLYGKNKDKRKVANCYLDLGTYYPETGERVKNLNLALEIYEDINDSAKIAYTLHTLGRVHLYSLNNYQKASEYSNKALKIYTLLGKRAPDFGIPWAKGTLGEIYTYQANDAITAGDKTLALKKLKAAIGIFEERIQLEESGKMSHSQSYEQLGDCYFLAGNIYTGKNQVTAFLKSQEYYTLLLAIGKKTNQKQVISHAYYSLSQISVSLGNYKQAYEHYTFYDVYSDSLYNEENTRKIIQSKMQYEFDKKEDATKAAQDKKDAITRAEIKNQKTIRNLLFVLASLIITFSVYSFYRYKRKKQLQNQQALMKERLRISRELHDEVGATLSGIAMYSHLTKEQIKNAKADEVEKSLNIMQQSSAEMVNKLNDIVWLINPEQDSLQKLIERLQEYAINMAAIKNMQVKVTVPEKMAVINLPVENRRNIYLFCKEAINNAVKYSQGSILELTIKEIGDKLEFSVSDNGKGFDAVMVRRGNGLENMQKRADEIGARLTLQSKQHEGAKVSLECKITQ